MIGGDIDEVEEKYGELKGWNKLNDAIESYFDDDDEEEPEVSEAAKKGYWHPPYDLNLEVAERLWTEKESSAYDDALANEDQKSQNKLLKIAFDRAKEKNINIRAVD